MIAAATMVAAFVLATSGPQPLRLAVPIVEQERERCGPAALGMVLRYYAAPDSALARAAATYDPVLRGALITDLARAARASGYVADVTQSTPEDLAAALEDGVPPIVLYDVGFGPLRKQHYAVVVGWDPARERFTLHDGRARPRGMSARELAGRLEKAGALALFVRRP